MGIKNACCVMSYLMGGVKGPLNAMLGNKGCSLAPYSGPTSGVFAGLDPRPSHCGDRSGILLPNFQ